MRKTSLACAMAALAMTGAFAAERAPPPKLAPGAAQRVLSLQPRIGPRTRAVVAQEAARIVSNGSFSFLQIRADIEAADLGAQGAGDIDALVQLVLLQAALDAETDLRNGIAAAQANIAQRKALRSLTAAMRRNERVMSALAAEDYARRSEASPIAPAYSLDAPTGLAGLDDRIATDQGDLERLNPAGDGFHLHLQMQMDHLAQMQALLFNLLKAADDVTAGVANTLK